MSTFFQIVLVLLVLLEAAFPYLLFRWLSDLSLCCWPRFLRVLSGLDYIQRAYGWRATRKGLTGPGAGSSLKTWSRA